MPITLPGRRLLLVLLLLTFVRLGTTPPASAQTPALIPSVRAAVARGDFAAGEQLIGAARRSRGDAPDVLEAVSWLGRGALAARQWDAADAYAREAYDRARAALAGRSMDQEPHLPIALGAAIEVRAQVAAQAGARTEAVAMLQRELAAYGNTSLARRIQKNINLLSLEGRPAPTLDLSESLKPRPLSLAAVKGKVVVLFFWAHWCPDCKAQAPILERLTTRYGPQGLTVLAPTQRYGYVARGLDATPEEEALYIGQVQRSFYGFLDGTAVPLSETNHLRYGVSTTPTIVVTDREGIVRAYHPGTMSEAELDPLVRRWLDAAPRSQSGR